MFNLIVGLYDKFFTKKREFQAEYLVVLISLVGLFGHLLIIFLINNVSVLKSFEGSFGETYLSAINTPFTFILYYEIFLFLFYLPKSLLASIGKQYEIISLLILRNVFKDLSSLQNFSFSLNFGDPLIRLLTDMFGGLLLFGLVVMFYKWSVGIDTKVDMDVKVGFVKIKKFISLILSFTLALLFLSNVFRVLNIIYVGNTLEFVTGLTFDFYKQFFIVLIFADVIILIISLLYTDNYGSVFVHAGFLVSTTLVRLSFVIGGVATSLLSVISVCFGLLLLIVYKQYCRDCVFESS